ncbi:MAG: glutamine amidotransferase [Verrucomicrobiota bacterium]
MANNTRVITVDRGKGPYRVLYVSGRPNWEFKFLNRALAEDSQVELVRLIRIAKKEKGFGQFEFRSRPGESANPLFRGFDRTTEDTEGYNEPVLKWLLPANSDTNWVSDGFPKTADQLFRFNAVILDDLEAEFFSRDQMSLLQRFVSERGGGLLMLGGAESFHQGKYEHTAIGEMLPVYLDFSPETKPLSNLRLSLTREGWLQPWARLRDNEASERTRLTELPALQVLNRVRDKKPGASVIAEVQAENGTKYPALVEQRFGNGRVGALLVGDLWRSGFARRGNAGGFRQSVAADGSLVDRGCAGANQLVAEQSGTIRIRWWRCACGPGTRSSSRWTMRR